MSSPALRTPKKLIEVALPLADINEASIHESYIYRGNPSSVHKWWAQRPLAASRAVLFAQLVNDPSWRWELENPGKAPPNHMKASWAASRKRLFALLSDLAKWENLANAELLARARLEIAKSWREVCEANQDHPAALTLFDPESLPWFADPFAGGGTIPLEAQRLGLRAAASDLNPVAALITKALIEIPPIFEGQPPVHPKHDGQIAPTEYTGSQGLSEDIRRYGEWVLSEAYKGLTALYPRVTITADMVSGRPDLKGFTGKEFTVLAWLWARTVRSPNPAFSNVRVPLASTFVLSAKENRQCWIEPVVEGTEYRFEVRQGRPPRHAKLGTKTSPKGANFRCLLSGSAISADWIRAEAKAGRLGQRLLAVVVATPRGRVYLTPPSSHETKALRVTPDWQPDVEFFQQALGFRVGNYGMTRWSDLFTDRQLVALSTFATLIKEVQKRVTSDAAACHASKDATPIATGGSGPLAYGQAVATYLAFALSKVLDYNCSLVPWYTKEDRPGHLFSKQTISMVWDFAEVNPLSDIGGSWDASVQIVASALGGLPREAVQGKASQASATDGLLPMPCVVSTDPPYYDNIGYSDLSDFFYVWLRWILRDVFPDLFSTITAPKAAELVATPGRHGTKEQAQAFFLQGMTSAMSRISEHSHPALPSTIYYAFKQSETSAAGTHNTGWETFLAAVIAAGFAITGTWPIRTERGTRSRGIESNALASSVVLVCRRRPESAQTISRRSFVRELNAVLPQALDEMTRATGEPHSLVAPVDLSQAIIGPGMAVFSRYAAVLEADGSPMSVRTALQLINRFLAEDDFDADTQFCLHWFAQHGWAHSGFGDANVLAQAKNTSVAGVEEAGLVESKGGRVRLRKWDEYSTDWSTGGDRQTPVWEALHRLIQVLRSSGEKEAGARLSALSSKAEAVRQLAYRLYTMCERQGRAEEARAYNEFVTSWAAVEAYANAMPEPVSQLGLFREPK